MLPQRQSLVCTQNQSICWKIVTPLQILSTVSSFHSIGKRQGSFWIQQRYWQNIGGKNNGTTGRYQHSKVGGVDMVENDLGLMKMLPGVGPKVAGMVLYVIYDEIYCIPVDRHVRRFAICFGFASSRVNDVEIGGMAECWFDKAQWINLNYVSAEIAQTLSLLKCRPALAKFQRELLTIANEYGFAEDMMNYIQMY
jgi:hypothetical protein